MDILTKRKTSPVLQLETYSKLAEKMQEYSPVGKYPFKVDKKEIRTTSALMWCIFH